MGFRMRRSIKIAPGVRLNVSSKSVGLSAGVRGARMSVNSSGRTTATVGIPGTGISYRKTSSTGRASTASRTVAGRTPVSPPQAKKVKPGLMAPAWEKQLFKQVNGHADSATIHAVGQAHPPAAATAAMVELLRVALPSRDSYRVRALVGWLFDTGFEPQTDPFISKYIALDEISVPIAIGVTAIMSWDRQALGLLSAEFEQEAGNLERAVTIVEQLEPTTIAAVSLAELYAETERWSEVVELTNELRNEDVASTFLLIQRGTALRELGFYEAARESLKEALRIRSRPTELRHLALIARGHTYLAEGKKSMAKKDYERVLANNAVYPGLQEMLAEVST